MLVECNKNLKWVASEIIIIIEILWPSPVWRCLIVYIDPL